MSIKRFFQYARYREGIRLVRKQGYVRSAWTNDPIFQNYRFCNVFREDDKVTAWFKKNIREPLRDDPLVFFATVAFRWFNRPETFKTLFEEDEGREGADKFDLFRYWGEPDTQEWIQQTLRNKGKPPYITGAYMVKTPGGMDKINGLMQITSNVWRDHIEFAQRADIESASLEEVHRTLVETFPYLGNFMAYEIVTDLRHTALMENAPDILTWASPGPGAARGAARCKGWPLDSYSYNKPFDRKELIEYMRCLLALSRKEEFWPQRWPVWEMREVEHTLCEFDKYERVRLGEGTPKQLFKPAKE